MTAERAKRIGRPAAEHDRHVDAARDRDIGARALLQKVEGQRLARLHEKARPCLARLAVDLRRQLGAGHRDHAVVGEDDLRPHEHRFEDRRARIVADKQVRRLQGEAVHAARKRDAEMIITGPAEILDGGGEAGSDDLNGHGAPLKLAVVAVDVAFELVEREGHVAHQRLQAPGLHIGDGVVDRPRA